LIALERVDSLLILPALFERILIPPEVAHEFGADYPWLNVEAPTNGALVSSLKLLLDAGEATCESSLTTGRHAPLPSNSD
jgi:predicted nucleic acid-binding protein